MESLESTEQRGSQAKWRWDMPVGFPESLGPPDRHLWSHFRHLGSGQLENVLGVTGAPGEWRSFMITSFLPRTLSGW